MPRSFTATRIRSVAWPPIWKPNDPPAMRMNTGALQPWPVRQVTTPWPYCAPTTNAPFTMPGTTATQVAERRILFGMAIVLGGHDLVQDHLGRIDARLQIVPRRGSKGRGCEQEAEAN